MCFTNRTCFWFLLFFRSRRLWLALGRFLGADGLYAWGTTNLQSLSVLFFIPGLKDKLGVKEKKGKCLLLVSFVLNYHLF